MAQLNSLIHEVIVTTLSESGQVHAAPMGISEQEGFLLIKPFKPSSTYDNLLRTKSCAVNFVDDVRIFAGAMTGHRDWPSQACEHVKSHYLDAALFHIEAEVDKIEDNDPRAVFYVKKVAEYSHKPFLGFNRAQSAVIEAAILVSRLGMLSEQKIQQEINYLTIAIEKTAGDREREAWGWLMAKIEQAGITLNHE